MASSRSITGNAIPARGLLGRRERLPELMDSPELPEADHVAALAGLARLNTLSGAADAVWRAVRSALPEDGFDLLDVACGGGDIAAGVARRARAAGVDARIIACDVSPLALRVTRDRFDAVGARASLVCADALAAPLPGPADAVTCSLFLHHLDDRDVVALLRAMARATRRILIVDDLVRGAWGYALASTVPRVVTRSSVVHLDARLSVRAAFTPSELRALAAEAGLTGARVMRHWPARQLLVWEPTADGRRWSEEGAR